MQKCPTCKQAIARLPPRAQERIDAITQHGVERAAEILGLSVRRVQQLAQQYGIERQPGRPWPKSE